MYKPLKFLIIMSISSFAAVIVMGTYGFIRSQKKPEISDAIRAKLPGKVAPLSIGKTYYEIWGPEDGEPILCVHGSTVYHIIWEKTVPALIDAGYKVITYDQYGRGFSDRPKINYTGDLYTTQIEELRKYLGIEKMHLMGISMGGGISTLYTALYPEATKSMILIASVNPDIIQKGILRTNPYSLLTRFLALKNSSLKSLINRAKEQFTYKGVEWAFYSVIKNRATFYLEEAFTKVGKLKLPTLIIWGSNDNVVPSSTSSRLLSYIPHGELHLIPDAGHSPNWEKPEQVNPLILAFLENNSVKRE